MFPLVQISQQNIAKKRLDISHFECLQNISLYQDSSATYPFLIPNIRRVNKLGRSEIYKISLKSPFFNEFPHRVTKTHDPKSCKVLDSETHIPVCGNVKLPNNTNIIFIIRYIE